MCADRRTCRDAVNEALVVRLLVPVGNSSMSGGALKSQCSSRHLSCYSSRDLFHPIMHWLRHAAHRSMAPHNPHGGLQGPSEAPCRGVSNLILWMDHREGHQTPLECQGLLQIRLPPGSRGLNRTLLQMSTCAKVPSMYVLPRKSSNGLLPALFETVSHPKRFSLWSERSDNQRL